jgi:uncharacterized protein
VAIQAGIAKAGILQRCLRVPALAFAMVLIALNIVSAQTAMRRFPVAPQPDDVFATGNEWISLPTIRASDAALMNFNVLSMKSRGLLQVDGAAGPAIAPVIEVDGKTIALANLHWELIEYWIPTAHANVGGFEITITYCAPPGSRAAFATISVANKSAAAAEVSVGLHSSWGTLSRVTYTPVELHGTRSMGPAPWVDAGEVFSFITDDTQFVWSLIAPGAQLAVENPPAASAPGLIASTKKQLAPDSSTSANFVLGVGVEEFSAAHAAKALAEILDREGAEQVIQQAAAWCRARTRTTGVPDLDLVMNRNFLFTEMYAWGKTLDTEQLVGVTSRSPRYYVSAAYWDRDAMLWSFPGLLDVDPAFARDALNYALTTQLRNTGVHSRFVDGVVLEDGYELDEGVAPIIALHSYVQRTHDEAFLNSHREALDRLRDVLQTHFDPAIGLYSTLQDAQDEYQKLPYSTSGNALTWRALLDLSDLYTELGDSATAAALQQKAEALHAAILRVCVSPNAPGAAGPIFARATDGTAFDFADVPPGSLLRLPAIGFIAEDDALFARTYDWLHSSHYKFSYEGQLLGLPGSYRLPITTSWSVADHLALTRGRENAVKILRATAWDNGIITEGISPETGIRDYGGRAFATAAGYVAHEICARYCTDAMQASATK